MLIDAKMDLLDNAFYEPIIRIDASGIGAPAAASPNYGEYSRLQFRDDKPPALSTQCTWMECQIEPCCIGKGPYQPYTGGSQGSMFGIGFSLQADTGHLEQPTTYPAWLEFFVC